MPDKVFSLAEIEALMLKSAELVDLFDEDAQPYLDYWEAKWVAKKKALNSLARIKKMIAENLDGDGKPLDAGS